MTNSALKSGESSMNGTSCRPAHPSPTKQAGERIGPLVWKSDFYRKQKISVWEVAGEIAQGIHNDSVGPRLAAASQIGGIVDGALRFQANHKSVGTASRVGRRLLQGAGRGLETAAQATNR